MQPKFTPEDLISLLYHETSPEQSRAIESCLEADAGLCEEFQQLSEAKAALDNDGRDRPHFTTLERIRAYAAEKILHEAH